jgi:hypothetical protein
MWRTNFRKQEKLVGWGGIAKTDAQVSRANEGGTGFKTLQPMAGASTLPAAWPKSRVRFLSIPASVFFSLSQRSLPTAWMTAACRCLMN